MQIVNNIIAAGAHVRGEIAMQGNLRIEGNFEGVIYTEGRVYISSTGKVFSDIHSDEVIVGGLLVGNIYAAKSIKFLNTGRIHGNMYTRKIAAEEGVLFEGDCVLIK